MLEVRSQFKNNSSSAMRSVSEEGSHVRLKDCCITQRRLESNNEEGQGFGEGSHIVVVEQTLSVECQVSSVKFQVSSVKCRVLSAEC